MNEHEPRVGDVISVKEWLAVGIVLEVIHPQGTGDRGRIVFHWMENARGASDTHPLSWVRGALANGGMKLVSRAEVQK